VLDILCKPWLILLASLFNLS